MLFAALLCAGFLGAALTRQTTRGGENQVERDAALIDAAARGDAAEVRRLLRAGASVAATDSEGRTALIAAAYDDHVEVGRLLIGAGADVNVQDNTRQSAYLIPTADGSLPFLRLTLQAGADVQRLDSYNGTGLIRAADRGHVEIIAELLQTDIAIDHVNRLGWTALLEAIILGNGGPRHTEVVRLLVAAGADVNLADSGGITPLAHAQRRGFAEIIAILQAAGAR
jgi:ankyrin repeat protein